MHIYLQLVEVIQSIIHLILAIYLFISPGNAGVLTYGGPGVPSQHVQTLGPGVYVVSPGHVVPVYPGDSTSGGPVFQVLPSNAAGASQSGIPRGAIPSSGNPPGYVTEGGVAPAYAPKANGETGLPPYDLPPPG